MSTPTLTVLTEGLSYQITVLGATMYSDSARTQTVTFPVTITNDTTWYAAPLSGPGRRAIAVNGVATVGGATFGISGISGLPATVEAAEGVLYYGDAVTKAAADAAYAPVDAQVFLSTFNPSNTDATTALAAFLAAIPSGGVGHIRSGTWFSTAPFIAPAGTTVVLWPGANLKAKSGFSGSALVEAYGVVTALIPGTATIDGAGIAPTFLIMADGAGVTDLNIQNSSAKGVSGTNFNAMQVKRCTISNSADRPIFVYNNSGANLVGPDIQDNVCDNSMLPTTFASNGVTVYGDLAANTANTFTGGSLVRNTSKLPSGATNAAAVCFFTRGTLDQLVDENRAYGGYMSFSIDTCSGENIGVNWAFGPAQYGYEFPGGVGGVAPTDLTASGLNLDGQGVTTRAWLFDGSNAPARVSLKGRCFNMGSGTIALLVSANSSKVTAELDIQTPATGVNHAASIQNSGGSVTFLGGMMDGQSVGQTGILINGVQSHIKVIGTDISGFTPPVEGVGTTAAAFTDILVLGVTSDQSPVLTFALSGGASVGAGVQALGNSDQLNILDYAAGVHYAGLPAVAWAATTSVSAYQIAKLPTGGLAYQTATRTTRASFDATERAFWTFLPGGHYEAISASGSYVVPNGITQIRERVLGGGGGGGGGGTALTSSGTAAQVPASGGGAGISSEQEVVVTAGQTLTVTVGGGGAGGTGGAVNSNAGTNGSSGTASSVTGSSVTTVSGAGGGLGAASGANSTTVVRGGCWGGGGAGSPLSSVTAVGIPGTGGMYNTANANVAPPGVVGGGAGSVATSTLGGNGGSASTSLPVASIGGASGNTASANGGNGTTATSPGCGGGGGGGGAGGGTGGTGGSGASGLVEFWY